MHEPRLQDLRERVVAVVEHHGPVETIDETRRPLYRHMVQNELVGGPSIIRFLDAPSGDRQVDALVLTHAGFDGDAVCRLEHLPAGRYAVVDFEGPPGDLEAARRRLRDWVQDHGLRATGPLLQVHHMDPIDGIVEEQLQLHVAGREGSPSASHLTPTPRREAMLKAGDAAPDFVLKDADGHDVRLSSFSGSPIVLFFYPKDNTPGCTIQAKRFKDHYGEIQAHGAVVVGVSLDPVERHRSFSDKCDLPFPLLADPDGRVHDLYDSWRTTLLGRSSLGVRRCTFLIDGDGIIYEVYRTVNVFTHANTVLKDLERLKAQKAWPKNHTGVEKERKRRKKESKFEDDGLVRR